MATDDIPPPALPPVDPAAADVLPGETITPELLAGLLADGDDELAASSAWTTCCASAAGPWPTWVPTCRPATCPGS